MVVPCRCRYCGQPTDRPVIFPLTIQRVFNYIFDNPGCSTFEIHDAVYGAHVHTNIVQVQISKIRVGLRDTDFRLITGKHPRPSEFGFLVRRMSTFKIVRRKPSAQPTTESQDVSP